jgi:C4-type Zn-finger protein
MLRIKCPNCGHESICWLFHNSDSIEFYDVLIPIWSKACCAKCDYVASVKVDIT